MKFFIAMVFSLGPFMAFGREPKTLSQIPSEVLSPCRDMNGKIAEIGQSWSQSDQYEVGQNIPHAALIEACQSEDRLQIICGKGGYGVKFLKVSVTKKPKSIKWEKVMVTSVSKDSKVKCSSSDR